MSQRYLKVTSVREGDQIEFLGKWYVVLATEREKDAMGERVVLYYGGGLVRRLADERVKVKR